MNERKFSLSAYPLSWPDGWSRTPESKRKPGYFLRYGRKASISDGVERIMYQLERLGVSHDDALISSNLKTRLDGTPRSDQPEPADSGVAVYWRTAAEGPMSCMAIDHYWKVAENLCAVGATLEAIRAIERHGGKQIQERTFRGFAALPASTSTGRPWWEVLGILNHKHLGSAPEATKIIEENYRMAAKVKHPDAVGGSSDAMAELNQARDEAYKWLREPR